MVYGTYNYSIHGVYKPTNITGGPHIVITAPISQLMRLISIVVSLPSKSPQLYPEGGLGAPGIPPSLRPWARMLSDVRCRESWDKNWKCHGNIMENADLTIEKSNSSE